jgi:hypothetical protein
MNSTAAARPRLLPQTQPLCDHDRGAKPATRSREPRRLVSRPLKS